MAASDVSDGPVMSLISKRLRYLRKKLNRITQMEESIAQGKPINKEQEEVLRTKPSVVASIDELEKLCVPVSTAVSEEISLALQRHQVQSTAIEDNHSQNHFKEDPKDSKDAAVEDLLNLLYFSSMFDAKSQTDFTATMLTKTHERGCCLTYDYVTDDDSADLLGERDLDLISMLGNFLISRPVNSSLSHKNALQSCIERSKLWLSNSDRSVDSDSGVTYAGLRAKLNKIMSSDYFTTTPEMKAPVEVAAAAAGNYGSFQGPVHGSVVPISTSAPLETSAGQHQLEEEEINSQENEIYDDQDGPVEELQKGESVVENSTEIPVQTEQIRLQEERQQNLEDLELEEQHSMPRRKYQNQRGGRGGGGGGRRGYSNGRGGRSGGGRGGGYRNGHNQYYEQSGNYYQRNYYNNRGRGGRGAAANFGNGFAVQAGNV